MSRLALRLAYAGGEFYGFQRQPNRKTVEGELLSILSQIDAIKDARSARYRASSRTDRGVCALGNVVSIDTSFNPKRLPNAINSKASGMWCTGIAVIPDDCDVRRARSRTYLCLLPDMNQDIEAMRDAAENFLGKHDFSIYVRVDGRNPIRTIFGLDIEKKEDSIEITVTGDSFLWNQVRRMVWAIDQVGRGKADPSEISPRKMGLNRVGLIPAEWLLLLSVDIGHEFEKTEPRERMIAELSKQFVASQTMTRVLKNVLAALSL